ncbi:MAG: RDD family protein [Deltaproteobacteria bacterium]|nr:RDD family protein [Deltaproteobacteria bacterium]
MNHFADGLPYTPAHAKKKPISPFAMPPSAPPMREPMPSQALRQAPVGTESARRLVEQFDSEVGTGAASPTLALETEIEAASFVRRVIAYGLDVFFSTMMFAVIVWSSFTLNGYDLAHLLSDRGTQLLGPLALLYLVVHMGYFLIQETTWQRTLGKAIMGIRIRTTSGFATLGRAVCFFIAAVPLGVGLFWYFFDSRHRCWHDVITDSEVVLS